MVDAKIFEARKTCGNDTDKMKDYIETNWNIKL